MDRLTKRGKGICVGLSACFDECDHAVSGCDCARVRGALNRLAAYEDTGLAPDEIPQLQEKYNTAIKALSGAILEKAEIPQWIPVSERLPEESDGDENGEVLIRKDGEDWITKVPWVKEEGATYWHRLPQPPKGENNEH